MEEKCRISVIGLRNENWSQERELAWQNEALLSPLVL